METIKEQKEVSGNIHHSMNTGDNWFGDWRNFKWPNQQLPYFTNQPLPANDQIQELAEVLRIRNERDQILEYEKKLNIKDEVIKKLTSLLEIDEEVVRDLENKIEKQYG